MADEILTQFYLGLHDLLGASVLTPREKKLIEIVNKQNAALEAIAAGTMTKSPQEIANLAKGATVVIVEKGVDVSPPEEPAKSLKLVPEAPTTVSGGLGPSRHTWRAHSAS